MTTPPALIALDIDGTLLASSGDVLPGTRAEIVRAREAGATIVLASGRPVAGLRRLVRRLQLDATGAVFSGLNGAMTVDADSGQVLGRHSLDFDLAHRITTLAEDHGVLPMLCDGDDLIVDDDSDPQVAVEADGNDLHLRLVPDLTALTASDIQVDKILMYSRPQVLQSFSEVFVAEFGEVTEHSFSAPFYFEATAQGIDKGFALADLAAARGIDVADSIAFGDNGNDIPLLRAAGVGVAMGNAIPDVMAVADRVTASHDDEGIAHVLMELFGGGEPAPPAPEREGVELIQALDLTPESEQE